MWHLCADPRAVDPDGSGDARAYATFISNAERRVLMWGQRVAEDDEAAILWDYHVVLLVHGPGEAWTTWDLDARAGAPLPAVRWLELAFGRSGQHPPKYSPSFRLIPAAEYRRRLHSDRRHMRDASGSFLRPPPPWPAILGEGARNNLDRFIDVTSPEGPGERLSLSQLRARVGLR
ncbi:hypothetical protein G6O69_04935 [Pseudenhygromyxa sp. WMMC2535]|nr:hypothetical protein [Pseudenhygromyxa sp. WMMC2535]